MLWFISVILALGKFRQEDCKLEVSLGYIAILCLKKENRVHMNNKITDWV
jgi:hypothetical protein